MRMGPTVLVCRKCKKHECLAEFLEDNTDASVMLVRCQKICTESVVGMSIGGRMEWFERVNKPKPLVALGRLVDRPSRRKEVVDRHTLPKVLEKRRVRKHSGRAPR